MSSLRLVLVGRTGAGKSSAGNTILGINEFKAGFSFSAVTAECHKGEGEVDGKTIIVVDTPGIADLKVSVEEAKDRVAECFRMSTPGPHAFLLVIKLGRFTAEEKEAADVIREVFGEAALKHTMVLFAHGDQLENPGDIETLLSGCEELTCLLDKVNWRYHVFNNKKNDRTQVTELLNKINLMVDERGHYTSEQFQKAEEKRKEEQEKERLRREEDELRQEWYMKPELRILLFGNTTESNKTARKIILEERCQYSGTDGCQKTNGEVLGRRVSVVETAGLSNMCTMSENAARHEILLCVCHTSPGPHAFVIVERSRGDSAERVNILKLIKDVFGDQALKYVMLLAIENSEHHASKAPHEHEHLPTHTFEEPRNIKQVTSLLQEIDRMVERNGGSFFTSDMFSEAEKAITEAQNKILANSGIQVTIENKLELNRLYINSRKGATNHNSFVSTYKIPFFVAVCGGVGAAVGGAIGAVVGGTGGTAGGGPAGALVWGTAGAVAGGKKGAAVGAAVGAGIAGVVGAISEVMSGSTCSATSDTDKKND